MVVSAQPPSSSTPMKITPGRPWPGRSLASAQMLRRSLLRSEADCLRSTRSDSRSTRNRSMFAFVQWIHLLSL